MNYKNIFVLIIFVVLWTLFSCDKIENPFLKENKSKGYENQAPETYLFLFFESDTFTVQDTTYDSGEPVIVKDTIITTLDTTSSRQEIHWWGEDPDGEVIGYYYRWNYEDTPTFTTAEAGTFYVPIRQQYDLFDFSVQAIDDDSLVDPTPARLTFPVYNTRPHIEFRLKSNPSAPPNNPNVTSYTFPTRTFVWDATDADGNETIKSILWALDDTTAWNVIGRDEYGILMDQLTLTGLSTGPHIFYVKAKDIASAESNTIMFPDSIDDNVPNHWVVKPVSGDVLLVDDYALDQKNGTTQQFYADILAEVIQGGAFSIWEIGSSMIKAGMESPNIENSLPYTQIDIEANLNYFNKVVWFSHMGSTHISESGLSITRYVKQGGKIFITNGNEQVPDTTWTFTDLDSVYRLNPSGRLMSGVRILAKFGDQTVNQNLTLETGKLIGNRVSALIPGNTPGTDAIYIMEHPDSASVSVPYSGTPSVGIRYKPDFIEGESIYFSLPLNYCDGRNNVRALLDYILNVEFED